MWCALLFTARLSLLPLPPRVFGRRSMSPSPSAWRKSPRNKRVRAPSPTVHPLPSRMMSRHVLSPQVRARLRQCSCRDPRRARSWEDQVLQEDQVRHCHLHPNHTQCLGRQEGSQRYSLPSLVDAVVYSLTEIQQMQSEESVCPSSSTDDL